MSFIDGHHVGFVAYVRDRCRFGTRPPELFGVPLYWDQATNTLSFDEMRKSKRLSQ